MRNHSLAQRLYDEHSAKLDLEHLTLEETLETLFSLRARVILRDAPLLHAFVVQGALGPTFQEESRRFFASCKTTLSRVMLFHKADMGHPDPELAAEVVCRTWLALMEQLVLYGDNPFDTPTRSSDARVLVAEFCRATAAYLRGDRAHAIPA